MYVCPMLIVDVISATNVKVQKSRKSLSQVVHVDKLKVCRGETQKAWLMVDVDDDDADAASEDETAAESTPDDDAGNDWLNYDPFLSM